MPKELIMEWVDLLRNRLDTWHTIDADDIRHAYSGRFSGGKGQNHER